jgi:methylenetetrahydrofolate--tRNA-(uracil-5-)-methyltransferase
MRIKIIGAGLAGSECAFQLAERGHRVDLFEMRPVKTTPAHQTSNLAELVCSNSFRSSAITNAVGLLKREMHILGSLVMRCGEEARVPAGDAFAVDRERFSAAVTQAVASNVNYYRNEMTSLNFDGYDGLVIATGPLTSHPLFEAINDFLGHDGLYFYDAIAPILSADSLDLSKLYWKSRYGKGSGTDYLNAPMSLEQYEAFVQALLAAELYPLHDFEKAAHFEGCLPIEEIASRGIDTLRFGPMKPVGLVDPRTGRRPFAVVQLRQDNLAASHFSVVGFQTQLKWGEQKRVFQMIPGLAHAEFVRMGMIHRNTYVNAPATLEPTFETRRRRGLFFAGQMSGVEGYVESAASGLLAGVGAAFRARGEEPVAFPEDTALGALGRYIARSDPKHYQPTNIAFGLLPELPQRVRDKARKRMAMAERALGSLDTFQSRLGSLESSPAPLPAVSRG